MVCKSLRGELQILSCRQKLDVPPYVWIPMVHLQACWQPRYHGLKASTCVPTEGGMRLVTRTTLNEVGQTLNGIKNIGSIMWCCKFLERQWLYSYNLGSFWLFLTSMFYMCILQTWPTWSRLHQGLYHSEFRALKPLTNETHNTQVLSSSHLQSNTRNSPTAVVTVQVGWNLSSESSSQHKPRGKGADDSWVPGRMWREVLVKESAQRYATARCF